MATLEQLSAALVKADAAGNAEDAKAFADEIRRMRTPEAPAARGQAGMFDILSAPFEMGAALAAKPRKEQVEFIAPAVEALGSAGGAIVGTGAGPLGTVVGAGAGYAGAKELLRLAAGEGGKETLPQAATRQAQNVLEGATMEAFGRGVVGPVISKGAEYANKLKNIKLDQYLKAVGDKGEEIVNSLRGRVQIVPAHHLLPAKSPRQRVA
jgi:hypothetical protein